MAMDKEKRGNTVKYLTLVLIGAMLSWSCQNQLTSKPEEVNTNELFKLDEIRVNMNFLASDELEGRETGTNSERVASLFIASELQKNGIQPFLGKAGYFQNIELSHIQFSDQSGFALVDENQKMIKSYVYGTNFICASGYYPALDTICALVFVGYGITAEEYGYDDYKDIDVKGKIVLMLPGEPLSEDTTYFEGEKLTTYAFPPSKLANAVNHGAIGLIRSTDWEKRFGWEAIRYYGLKGKFQLRDQPIEAKAGQIPEIVISDTTIKDILSQDDKTYVDIQAAINQGNPLPVFELPFNAEVNWQFDTTLTVTARNVIALSEGNDPDLKKEYVGLGAHFDHVGVGPEGVYNGADDNASGTVALLEVAKAFAKTRQNKRSIFLAFHTAEEKGLLGSKYLASKVPALDQMIAYINMDMVGRGSEDSIYSIGSDKLSSEFKQMVEAVNAAGVNIHLDYRFDDPNDTQRFYYRSDHYNYAKRNIPIIFFFDYQMDDYHRVTDDPAKINFQKIQKIARLSFEIALKAANRSSGFKLDNTAEKSDPSAATD